MAELTDGTLPIIEIPETYHHMMFDEPLATTMAIKATLLAWQRQDHNDRYFAALERNR
jgi:hypothetical protein